MKLRFLAAVFALLAILLGFSSISKPTARELSDLQFVRVIGCDAADGGGVSISCSVAAIGSGAQDKAIMLRKEAPSLSEAALGIETFTPKSVFFGYTDYLMLGEEAARSGLREWLDFFERDMYLRLGIKVYVTAETTAGEVVQSVTADGDPLSPRLEIWCKAFGTLPVPASYTLREMLMQLDRTGCAVCPAVELAEGRPGDESTEPEHQGGGDSGKTMRLRGYAVFMQQRLAGYIGMDKLAAANILLGQSTLTPLSFELRDGGKAALLLVEHKVKYTPEFSEAGALERFGIDVSLSLNINELSDVSIPFSEAVTELTGLVSERVERDIVGLVDQSKAYGGDWFDFGRTIELKEPAKWKNVDWRKEFTALPFEVHVQSTISRTYEIGRSLEEPE